MDSTEYSHVTNFLAIGFSGVHKCRSHGNRSNSIDFTHYQVSPLVLFFRKIKLPYLNRFFYPSKSKWVEKRNGKIHRVKMGIG